MLVKRSSAAEKLNSSQSRRSASSKRESRPIFILSVVQFVG